MTKKYKDDYGFKQVKKEDGTVEEQVVYKGKFYLNNCGKVLQKQFTVRAFLISFFTMWLFFVSGFFDNAGSHCLYVMIPYICIFLPAAYFILAAFNVWQAPAQLTREKYDKSFGRCKRMPTIIAVLSILSIVCDGIFILLNKETVLLENELLFCFFLLVIAGLNIFFLRLNKNSFECIKIQE